MPTKYKPTKLDIIRQTSAYVSSLPKEDKAIIKSHMRNNTVKELADKAMSVDYRDPEYLRKANLYSQAASLKDLGFKMGGRKTRKHKKARSTRRRKHM